MENYDDLLDDPTNFERYNKMDAVFDAFQVEMETNKKLEEILSLNELLEASFLTKEKIRRIKAHQRKMKIKKLLTE